MTATVHILPIVPRVAPHDPDWREQYDRTCMALIDALREPPERTRPMLVKQLTDCQRPEGER